MSMKKTIISTVLVAVLTAIVLLFLTMYSKPVFYILAACFALYGFFSAFEDFNKWLAKPERKQSKH